MSSLDENFDSSRFFTVAEGIELCLDPNYADHKFLQYVLQLFAKKLQLDTSIIASEEIKRPESVPIIISTPKKDDVIFVNLFNYNKIAADLELKVAKITRILDKMSLQHEMLLRKFDEKSTTFSIKPSRDTYLTGESSVTNSIPFLPLENIQAQLSEEMNCLRMEFHKCVLDLKKDIKKIIANSEKYENLIRKMEEVEKIFDYVVPKDYVNSINDRVEQMCIQVSDMEKKLTKMNCRVEDVIECSRYSEKRILEIQKNMQIISKIREIIVRCDRFDIFKKKIFEELDKFTEITEFLKVTKANKEELDYLFKEKADRDELLKLVTLEFFKSVQDDLSGGIVHVLEQLMRDEIEWERAYKEIQLMLDAKADHNEVTSLKQYINCKLQIIQKKIDDIIKSRLTSHAAAVKIRVLKDARCITCTTEADLNQVKYPIPMMPSYLHKEYKCICEPKTRYCGGSHTALGADQKLIGKPRAPIKALVPTTLNYTMSAGKDGKLYRTRTEKCQCNGEK